MKTAEGEGGGQHRISSCRVIGAKEYVPEGSQAATDTGGKRGLGSRRKGKRRRGRGEVAEPEGAASREPALRRHGGKACRIFGKGCCTDCIRICKEVGTVDSLPTTLLYSSLSDQPKLGLGDKGGGVGNAA